MGKGGGRPRDKDEHGKEWREHVTKLEGTRVRCNYCPLEFVGSTNRIKSHITKDKGNGIQPCPNYPQPKGFGSRKANSNNDLEDSLLLFEGQIQDDAKDHERIQAAGSSSVSNWENEDLQVIRYVSESLSSEDMVFKSPRLHLTQKEFVTLVKPETWLDSSVIDAFVEILTDAERKKPTSSNWYLPLTTFSQAALAHDLLDFKHFVESHKMKENYMCEPKSPEKVFIPVHIEQESCGHFYLYIINLKSREIEIWDSLPKFVNEGKRLKATKRLLLAMEELFKEEGTFNGIKSEMADGIPSQTNGSDCGIFVIKYMEQSDNYVKINDSFKFDSKKEREHLTLKLLKSHLNQEKQNLYDKARRHYVQVEKQDGKKRLRVDSDERVNRHYGLQKALIGKNFRSYVEKIWAWIMDGSVSAIGVCGMGGSGKTALAYHIHDKLLEEASGDIKVIWLTVSQNSIYMLQKVVARSIKLNISNEFEVKRIAPKIFQAFKEMKRCVVILDDVWDHFFLEEIGFPMSDNRVTLILTTRIWEVCQGMGCEKSILVVKPLNARDSWKLFKKISGFHEGLFSKVWWIAMDVADECAGLPLAIVRIATSMKGKKQVGEWSHILECLENLGNGQYEMDKWVLPVLRSSYDFLNNKLQKFFLYYVLTAKAISGDDGVNRLIRRFAYESMDETKKFRVQYNEGYNMLDKLKNHNMLYLKRKDDDDDYYYCEDDDDDDYDYNYYYDYYYYAADDDEDIWRIRKFVGVMASGIAECNGEIMADAYKNLTEIPSDDRWRGDLKKVFLTGNQIKRIPAGTCPSCSQLSTLLLDRNAELNYISNDFFKNMPTLKTLDLSETGIKVLPKSVSCLKCLVALILSRCRKLRYIPPLSKLKRLISLDLSYTAIIVAPMGLESSVNLRYLNLLGTYESVIRASVISKLINLEWLELCLTDVTVRCIPGLKKLEVIAANFCDVSVFNTCVRFIAEHDVIRCYCLTLWGEWVHFPRGGRINSDFCMKRITFRDIDLGNGNTSLLGDINELCVCKPFTPEKEECRQGRIGDGCLCRVFSYAAHDNNDDAHKIERVDIWGRDDVEYLCCLRGSCPFCSSSQLVGSLSLTFLENLKSIVSPPEADSLHESTLLSHLTDLRVWGCHNMETLMTSTLIACLKNLRTISVGCCMGMKEMVGEDDSETQLPAITLPNLTSLKLNLLLELMSVYRGVMLCPSLQTFFAIDCKGLDHPPRIQISAGCELQFQKSLFGGYFWKSD